MSSTQHHAGLKRWFSIAADACSSLGAMLVSSANIHQAIEAIKNFRLETLSQFTHADLTGLDYTKPGHTLPTCHMQSQWLHDIV